MTPRSGVSLAQRKRLWKSESEKGEGLFSGV